MVVALIVSPHLLNIFAEICIDVEHPVAERAPHVIFIKIAATYEETNRFKEIEQSLTLLRIVHSL